MLSEVRINAQEKRNYLNSVKTSLEKEVISNSKNQSSLSLLRAFKKNLKNTILNDNNYEEKEKISILNHLDILLLSNLKTSINYNIDLYNRRKIFLQRNFSHKNKVFISNERLNKMNNELNTSWKEILKNLEARIDVNRLSLEEDLKKKKGELEIELNVLDAIITNDEQKMENTTDLFFKLKRNFFSATHDTYHNLMKGWINIDFAHFEKDCNFQIKKLQEIEKLKQDMILQGLKVLPDTLYYLVKAIFANRYSGDKDVSYDEINSLKTILKKFPPQTVPRDFEYISCLLEIMFLIKKEKESFVLLSHNLSVFKNFESFDESELSYGDDATKKNIAEKLKKNYDAFKKEKLIYLRFLKGLSFSKGGSRFSLNKYYYFLLNKEVLPNKNIKNAEVNIFEDEEEFNEYFLYCAYNMLVDGGYSFAWNLFENGKFDSNLFCLEVLCEIFVARNAKLGSFRRDFYLEKLNTKLRSFGLSFNVAKNMIENLPE
ncbi:hypothetical protein HK099_002165 [Clydaea vesicula]|uniref:Uncharacterized protein n=1 Tax=Clydaea vesicula TaxID=447962 RepID=A0AAD5U7J5_9FUNG|nr:hypothetical protein HK099_002165 [Clydaea vesicula]KAJ3396426.1 hypothetical protein HDU92_003048 [Lobulomyces angularis]